MPVLGIRGLQEISSIRVCVCSIVFAGVILRGVAHESGTKNDRADPLIDARLNYYFWLCCARDGVPNHAPANQRGAICPVFFRMLFPKIQQVSFESIVGFDLSEVSGYFCVVFLQNASQARSQIDLAAFGEFVCEV